MSYKLQGVSLGVIDLDLHFQFLENNAPVAKGPGEINSKIREEP